MKTSKNVLVVDDDCQRREEILAVLSGTGAFVDVATNGLDAIRKLHERRFDCVIIDLTIPLISAYEVLKLARARNPETTPIALSEAGAAHLKRVGPGLVTAVVGRSAGVAHISRLTASLLDAGVAA